MLTEIEANKASLDFEARPKEVFEAISAVFRETLYEVFLRHQSSIKKNRSRGTLRTRLQLTFVLVQTLQLVSIVLEQCGGVADYSSYQVIENVLVSLRVDLWAEKIDMVEAAVVASLAAALTSVAALIIEMITVRVSPETALHPLLLLTADLPSAVVHRLLLLPILLLYLKCLFYSILAPRQSPYNTAWSGFLSFFGLLTHGTLILLRIDFLYESAWYNRTHKLLARPNPTFELKEAAISVLIAVFMVLRKSAELNVLVTAGLCAYLLFDLLLFQPYYHPLTLTVKAVQYSGCAWVSLAAEVAIGTDSMGTGIFLVLFVTPCIATLTACLQRWRATLIKYRKTKQHFWQYELSWRTVLREHEETGQEQTLLECMQVGERSHRMLKDYYLLLAQYYFYHRDLPEIALLRLAMTKGCVSGLVSDFQVLRLARGVSQLSISEERDYVDYETSFLRARELDQKLCENTCEVFNVLLHKNTTNAHLERAFVQLSQVMQSTKDTYHRLKQRFPSDPFVLEVYGSLVENLFHDKAGHDLITRGSFERNRRKKANINVIESYSSDDTGVLVISCDPDHFGKITYANKQLATILRCNLHEIIGKDLDDFIPPPYNYQHNNKLHHFLSVGEAKQIFRKNLFLSSMGRFSVEVTFRFRPTAVNNVPYFLTAVRQKRKNREFVLFNDSLEVTSHSSGFKQLLKVFPTNLNLAGVSIESLLPGISAKYKSSETGPFTYHHPDLGYVFGAMFASVELGSQLIQWLYLFNQVREMEDLFASTAPETLKEIRHALAYTASSVTSEEKTPESSTPQRPTGVQIDLLKKERDVTLISSTNLKETRDDCGSSVVPSHTSFAASPFGLHLRRRVLHAVKTYKFSYLLTMFLASTLIAISLAIVYTTFHSMTDNNKVMELGQTRLQVVKIVHLVRRISLAQLGLETQADKESLAFRLRSEIDVLQAEVDRHLSNTEEMIPLWVNMKGNYEFKMMPLVTALSDFCTNARLQADDPSSSGSEFFYVYSNGPASILPCLNSTVASSLSALRSSAFAVIATASTVSMALVSTVLVASTLFVARSLAELRSVYNELWQCITKLPTSSIHETMQVHKERIEIVHGDEYQLTEQTRVRNNPGILIPPNNCAQLTGFTAAFVLITTAFLVFTVVYGNTQVEVLLDSHTNYLNTKSITTFLPTFALMLLKEAYLVTTQYPSYYSLHREGQAISSLSSELQNVLQAMEEFESRVLLDTEEITEMSAADYADDLRLILENACPFVNSSSPLCANSALARGQHPGFTEMRTMLLHLSQQIHAGEAIWDDIISLEQYLQLLTDATELTEGKVESYSTATSQAFVNQMLIYSCLYILASAGLYLFLYLPLITSLKTKCMSIWRVSSLLRHDLVSIR